MQNDWEMSATGVDVQPIDSVSQHPPLITGCPTCGQRVVVKSDGSYRPITELQHNSEKSYRQHYQRFVWKIIEETRLLPKKDWRELVSRLHKEALRVKGNSWLLLDEDL